MKADAEAHSADDEKRKGLVEARNIADQAIYAGEKSVKEHGEKAGAELVKEVQDKIEALKTARNSEDAGTIKSATEALSSALMKIGEAMAKSSEQQAGAGGSQTPPSSDSGGTPPPPETPPATDAEFKEKP